MNWHRFSSEQGLAKRDRNRRIREVLREGYAPEDLEGQWASQSRKRWDRLIWNRDTSIAARSKGAGLSCACWTRWQRAQLPLTRRTFMLDPWVEFPLPP